MTALDNTMRKVVRSLARSLGTAVTVRVITAGAYDTSTGTATDTEDDTDVQGFLLSEAELEAFGLAKVADRAVLVPAASLATEPVSTQDRFLVGSTVYVITKVDPIRAQDSQAAYVLHGTGPGG